MKNWIFIIIIAVSGGIVGAFSLKGAGTLQMEKRGEVLYLPIDCNKHRPQIRVRSSVDGNFYDVDVCAVTDSAEGEDFRQPVKK